MKQTNKLDYACGVIACIHAVFNNIDKIELKKDSVLEKFYRGTKNQTPIERAISL
jgi:ubiquitin carboxyl-terminal hydrolase L3